MFMKFILIISFLVLSSIVFGQIKNKETEYTWLLDSVKINVSKDFFDPAIIDVIKIIEDSATQNRKGYLKSKESKKYKFISLYDAANLNKISYSTPAIFMVNNDFLKDDISSYRIDSFYILKVEIIKANELISLRELNSSLTIIRIKTKTPENIEEEERIRINGTRKVMPALN